MFGGASGGKTLARLRGEGLGKLRCEYLRYSNISIKMYKPQNEEQGAKSVCIAYDPTLRNNASGPEIELLGRISSTF